METRHIKLDYEEALTAKKQLLSSELNILQTTKKVRNYKVLRKKEIATKTKLKTAITSIKTKINHLQTLLPDQDIKISKHKTRKTRIQKQEKQSIQKELEDIQGKLEKLR
jgi:hypothetical protein